MQQRQQREQVSGRIRCRGPRVESRVMGWVAWHNCTDKKFEKGGQVVPCGTEHGEGGSTMPDRDLSHPNRSTLSVDGRGLRSPESGLLCGCADATPSSTTVAALRAEPGWLWPRHRVITSRGPALVSACRLKKGTAPDDIAAAIAIVDAAPPPPPAVALPPAIGKWPTPAVAPGVANGMGLGPWPCPCRGPAGPAPTPPPSPPAPLLLWVWGSRCSSEMGPAGDRSASASSLKKWMRSGVVMPDLTNACSCGVCRRGLFAAAGRVGMWTV